MSKKVKFTVLTTALIASIATVCSFADTDVAADVSMDTTETVNDKGTSNEEPLAINSSDNVIATTSQLSTAEKKESELATSSQLTKIVNQDDTLTGTWTVDGITNLRFSSDGSGAMILPEFEEAFLWSIHGDDLGLSFENAEIGEVEYTLTTKKDKIVLSSDGRDITLKQVKDK